MMTWTNQHTSVALFTSLWCSLVLESERWSDNRILGDVCNFIEKEQNKTVFSPWTTLVILGCFLVTGADLDWWKSLTTTNICGESWNCLSTNCPSNLTELEMICREQHIHIGNSRLDRVGGGKAWLHVFLSSPAQGFLCFSHHCC